MNVNVPPAKIIGFQEFEFKILSNDPYQTSPDVVVSEQGKCIEASQIVGEPDLWGGK
jgi:hypothetical protein